VRALLGVRLASFRGDDVLGVAIPAVVGAGFRARVSPLVAVGADIAVEAGVGLFSDGLGTTLQFGFATAATVELRLD
jgi:hypothetical protein